MEIKELCTRSHETAKEKGFYGNHERRVKFLTDLNCTGIVGDLTELEIIRRLDLIHSELGESLEALRKNKRGLLEKDTFEDEIADVFIRLGDLCGWLDIDIEQQIEWKMNFNTTREKMHGKQF